MKHYVVGAVIPADSITKSPKARQGFGLYWESSYARLSVTVGEG